MREQPIWPDGGSLKKATLQPERDRAASKVLGIESAVYFCSVTKRLYFTVSGEIWIKIDGNKQKLKRAQPGSTVAFSQLRFSRFLR